jgi:hypothetical protein
MAEKKIQPKRPTGDEPAAGSRKAGKTTMKAAHKKTLKAAHKKTLKAAHKKTLKRV